MPAFPRVALVVPPLIPLALYGVGALSNWSMYSTSGETLEPWVRWLNLLSAIAIVVELCVVPWAMYRLGTRASVRTRVNLACFAFAAAMLACAIVTLIVTSPLHDRVVSSSESAQSGFELLDAVEQVERQRDAGAVDLELAAQADRAFRAPQ
jgi:cytochrome bd-type quinol oxidase subunit 2